MNKTTYKTPRVVIIKMDAVDGLMDTCSVPKGSGSEIVDKENEILSKDHKPWDWSMDE